MNKTQIDKIYWILWRSCLLCLVHTADTDKTRLSCLVCVSGVNWIRDKTRQFSVVLNIFDTEQLLIGNWVETRQNCIVLSVWVVWTQFARQDSFVLSWPSFQFATVQSAQFLPVIIFSTLIFIITLTSCWMFFRSTLIIASLVSDTLNSCCSRSPAFHSRSNCSCRSLKNNTQVCN